MRGMLADFLLGESVAPQREPSVKQAGQYFKQSPRIHGALARI
jgi:hypothetical protein